MSMLPDEIWRRIMEIGIETKTLDYRSLCCISITCRRLRRLAAEDSLWSALLLSDFPSSGSDLDSSKYDDKISNRYGSSSAAGGKFKSLYRIRYVKDSERKRLAHRRVLLRIESEIAVVVRKIREIELQSCEEKEKMNKAIAELENLRKLRQASVALNVWQPEIVRDRQKQVIQQSNVPVDFRMNALEMELSLCKQQITGFGKALHAEKRKLDDARDRLAALKYHPSQDFSSTSRQQIEHWTKSKKLKHSSNK